MKKILFIYLFGSLAALTANAQDVITLKNGDEIKAKVLEIGANDVKYKKFGNESGPTYTESKTQIFMIKYENGDKDVFNAPSKASNTESSADEAIVRRAVRSSEASETQYASQRRQSTTNRFAQADQARIQAQNNQEYAPDEPSPKAYIGLGVGPAFMVDTKDIFTTGTLVSVNFGYMFSKNVGITAYSFITDFPNKPSVYFTYNGTRYDKFSIGLLGFLVGPLFSTPADELGKIELDFRPTLGFVREQETYGSNSGSGSEVAVALGLGVSIRFNLSNRFALSGNMDYYNGKVEDLNLSSFGISIGANYRW